MTVDCLETQILDICFMLANHKWDWCESGLCKHYITQSESEDFIDPQGEIRLSYSCSLSKESKTWNRL